jgi:glycosyltransferase involved in cell wall biosynthesis
MTETDEERRSDDIDGAGRTSIRTSIVVPAYNEVDSVGPLVDEVRDRLDAAPGLHPYEIVLVDDGSTDGTRAALRDLAGDHAMVRAVLLRRNYGQSAALAAGIDTARGDVIVTMDADGQNDPADIPALVSTLEEGYDCVSGWRRDRDDPLGKRVPSAIQTRLAKLTGPDIHDFGCTLTAYRASALADIRLYGEAHRYIPAMLHKRGYRITELEVNHRPRTHGDTKYGWRRLLRGFVDLCFHVFWNRYSTRPLHFLGGAGVIAFGAGGLIGVHALLLKYAFRQALVPKLPRLVLAIALLLFGLQLFTFGFLAEMLTKLYYRDDTPYGIEAVVGAQKAPEPAPDT